LKRLIASTVAVAFVAALATSINAQTTGSSTTAKQTTTTATKPAAQKPAPAPKTPLLDINSAPKDKLVAVGFTDAQADAVIKGRPWASKSQLVTKKVLDKAAYDKLSAKIVATQPKAK